MSKNSGLYMFIVGAGFVLFFSVSLMNARGMKIQHTNDAMVAMVEAGASPIDARCAVSNNLEACIVQKNIEAGMSAAEVACIFSGDAYYRQDCLMADMVKNGTSGAEALCVVRDRCDTFEEIMEREFEAIERMRDAGR